MEQVNPAADRRSRDILDRVKAVFCAKGFDGASMQDLAVAAGMSAGNFYRYFPSKNAIIEALAQQDLERMETEIGAIFAAADPRKAFGELLRARVENIHCDNGPLWAEIEAASFRKPEIAALRLRMEQAVTAKLASVLGRIAGVGDREALERFGAHACFLVLLVTGLSTASRPTDSAETRERNRRLSALVIEAGENAVASILRPSGLPSAVEA
jgi:AcrR family transcriptional regulator